MTAVEILATIAVALSVVALLCALVMLWDTVWRDRP